MTGDYKDVSQDISRKPETATHPQSVEKVLRNIPNCLSWSGLTLYGPEPCLLPQLPNWASNQGEHYEDQQEYKHDFNA